MEFLWSSFLIGVVIGGLVCLPWIVMQWRTGSGESIQRLKQENEKFREEVTEHFVETARLINQMTDSYKAVFDHLSQGAEKLVDDKALSERMPRVSQQEVKLRHLGAPESKAKAAAPSSVSNNPAPAPGGGAKVDSSPHAVGAKTDRKSSAPAANPDPAKDSSKPVSAKSESGKTSSAKAGQSSTSSAGQSSGTALSSAQTGHSSAAKPDPLKSKQAQPGAADQGTGGQGTGDGQRTRGKSASSEAKAAPVAGKKGDVGGDQKSAAEASADQASASKQSSEPDAKEKDSSGGNASAKPASAKDVSAKASSGKAADQSRARA